ncbi:MAG: substrate-binding and VWA domain-containing protein [Pseudomonadota bacterium]
MMGKFFKWLFYGFMGLFALAFVFLLIGEDGIQVSIGDGADFTIVSGSENKALEPIIKEWGAGEGLTIEVAYRGSVDIARMLADGADAPYDAVWPANGLWTAMGDKFKVVKFSESILRSPVVLGLKRSIAERLGWIGRDDLTIAEIAEAAKKGDFRLAMTSATQSNSGASAYFGFLHAFAGQPDVLTAAHLEDAGVRDRTAALLAAVDRSSGSSGWLKEAFVENPDRFDAMINYEALMIEANQALIAAGGEPLYVVYPADGMAVADSPLGYIEKGDKAKAAVFDGIKRHLLSVPVQEQLQDLGRRASLIGMGAGTDPAVWNPDWGIDGSRSIAPIPTPAPEVIQEALRIYQTDLRKPSLTVWLLDVSGSMEGEPIDKLREAMALLFDPTASSLSLLQPSARDIAIVIPFNSAPGAAWRVDGNDPAALRAMIADIRRLRAGGGTDVYAAGLAALDALDPFAAEGTLFDRLPAIIALTDGASSIENRELFLEALAERSYGRDIPIHAIALGEADERQLDELNAATVGRLFDARTDMAKALKSAKGYN